MTNSSQEKENIRKKMKEEFGDYMDYNLEWIDCGPFHYTKRYLYNCFGQLVIDPFFINKNFIPESILDEEITFDRENLKVTFEEKVKIGLLYNKITTDDSDDEYYPLPQWALMMYAKYEDFLNSKVNFDEEITEKYKIKKGNPK